MRKKCKTSLLFCKIRQDSSVQDKTLHDINHKIKEKERGTKRRLDAKKRLNIIRHAATLNKFKFHAIYYFFVAKNATLEFSNIGKKLDNYF